MDQESMNVTNEVLGAKLDAVGQRVEKVELKVDGLGTNYVAHDIFELRLKELETAIATIKIQLNQLASRRLIVGTSAAVFASILTLLAQYYITNVNR
jgi:hypothetical protein